MGIEIAGLLLIGLIGLVAGGELLIRGAVYLASALGISALVIGLTVVAMGTSAPELVVSLKATLSGNADIAAANVVGSNIFNVLFILGLCAVFAPLTVASQLIRWDVPLMILASGLVWVFSLNGVLSPVEGIFFILSLAAYTGFLIVKSRKESNKVQQEFEREYKVVGELSPRLLAWNTLVLIVGLVFLIFGAGWFVDGAVRFAKLLGVSDTIIGLTIVAAGTSLPEVATSVLATLKGEREIAIGNVVGSNLFNIMAILGITSAVSPKGLSISSDLMGFDIPFMVVVALASLPIFWTGFKINRWEGILFLGSYIAYCIYLIYKAGGFA